MKKITILCTFLITLLIGMTTAGVSATPEETPLLYVNPPTYTATSLTEFTINVNVANASNLKFVQFMLGYNATILNATNVIEGPFMKTFGDTYFYMYINETQGYILVGIAITKGGPAQGDGTLATTTFKPTYYGSVSCALNLYNTSLADPDGTPMDHDVADGFYKFEILYLTVKTEKINYNLNESVNIHGNLTRDGSTIDGLVALEVRDPKDRVTVVRTQQTGTNPPGENITILNLYPCDSNGIPKYNFYKGTLAYFNVTVRNNGAVSKTVTITINTYDTKNVPFSVSETGVSLSPGTNVQWISSAPIPDWASAGTASVYASALTDMPRANGVAYCPERSATFGILELGGGAAALEMQKPSSNPSILTGTLGSYNLTLKLPSGAARGMYRVYASSGYQGQYAISSTVFGVEVITVPYLFPTIQAAVDAASPGNNSILVDSGTYYEHVTINKPITLFGFNAIIDGNGTGTVVHINAANVEIGGFTIQNSGSSFPSGIILNNCSGNTISGNTISNNYNGIYLNYSSNNYIGGNIITSNNGYGICLASSDNNRIIRNTLSKNNYGIYLNSSTENTLRYNTITDNNYNFGVEGDSLSDFTHVIDTSNTVNGKPIYYWINKQNQQIPSSAGYVAVVNSTNITVKGPTLTKNGQGVLFVFTNKSLIERVNAKNNQYGIYLDHSYGNTIVGSTVSDNAVGIYLTQSNGNVICRQNFINNTNQVELHLSSNTWEDGMGKGNYWSDYNGTDTNGDGIGDTNIPWQGVDYRPLMNPWTTVHDVAAINITVSIYSSWVINVNVTVRNEGDFVETFNVTAYLYNQTYTKTVGSRAVTDLLPLKETNVTVTCIITGVSPGIYTIKVVAIPVPGETDTGDNTLIVGTISTVPGDANGDGKVNVIDLGMLGRSWLTKVGDPKYDPRVDFNGDGKINVLDLGTIGFWWLYEVPK